MATTVTEDTYSNKPILYFDTFCFSVASISETILLIIWCYGVLFHNVLQKHVNAISEQSTDINTNNLEKSKSDVSLSPSPSPTARTVAYQKVVHKPKHHIDKVSQLLCAFCITAGTLFCYGFTAHLLFMIITDSIPKYGDIIWCNTMAGQFVLNFIQRIFLYSYYIWRVYQTFNQSIFELPKTKMIITSCVLLILWIFAVIFYFVYFSQHECDANALFISLIPGMILEMFSCSFGALLFILKLYELLKVNKENSERMTSLKYLLYKLCILASITLCSSSVLIIGMFVFGSNSVIGIDAIVNSLCLLLSFTYYDNAYKKLCVICRKQCVDA